MVKNQKGFSLLDAVLGTLVMSFGFLSLIPCMSSATAQTLKTDHYVTATQIANEDMENILADMKFNGIDSITENAYSNTNQTGSNSEFVRTVTVTEVNADDLTTPEAGSGYKKVDVTVSWGTEAGEQVVISTLLTNS